MVLPAFFLHIHNQPQLFYLHTTYTTSALPIACIFSNCLYHNSIAMVHLMLDNLRCPTGILPVLPLKIPIKAINFNLLISGIHPPRHLICAQAFQQYIPARILSILLPCMELRAYLIFARNVSLSSFLSLSLP